MNEFKAIPIGKELERYLKNVALTDDMNDEVRVYIVKDMHNNIVAYYALKCGLLYESKSDIILDANEGRFKNLIATELIKGNDKIAEAYYQSSVEFFDDVEKANKIYEIAKKLAKKSKEEGNKTKVVLSVYKYHPAIELSHFCKNIKYRWKNSSIPLGAGIFWEIIMPHIIEITKLVGCKYLYLFAADNTENNGKRLLKHYQKIFKLKSIEGLVAVRPDYEGM